MLIYILYVFIRNISYTQIFQIVYRWIKCKSMK